LNSFPVSRDREKLADRRTFRMKTGGVEHDSPECFYEWKPTAFEVPYGHG
jgi:hypothetical protein